MERTSIQISKNQKQTLDTLKNYEKETYREVLQRLIDDYGETDGSELDEQRVRTITRETVNDMVLPKALE